MLSYYERTHDSIRDYIRECIPEHLQGYDNGWLLVNHIKAFGQTFSHIYSWKEGSWKLIGTHVGFTVPKDEEGNNEFKGSL